jgi:transglutaminase-like putative cysteine protease
MNAGLTDYLQPDEWVNSGDPSIRSCARTVIGETVGQVERAERLYRFVRDDIQHSWDAKRSEVNGKASDVLAGGHGICYGKSHLLAALLRAVDIPAGMAYQRLTLFDDPKDGHAIHALNTDYLADVERWIRLDARGNKAGIDARFSLDTEYLAFPIRATHGERDYKVNHAAPHPAIAQVLQSHTDCLEMYRIGLPTDLEYPI